MKERDQPERHALLPLVDAGQLSSVLGKRDTTTASESEKEESKSSETAPAQPPKKRRIAPTLVSAGTDAPSSSKDGADKPGTSG